MRSAVLICLFALAAAATAEEKVTGYKTASAAVVAKSGKILISTVLTPEVQDAPVNEIQPIVEPSILPVVEAGNKLPIIQRPEIQPLPVVSPPVAPVISPIIAPIRPAPLPADGGALIPEIIVPEKPAVSILPIVETGNKLPIIQRPEIQPLPVVSPPVAPVISPIVAPIKPAPLPADGGALIPEIIAPEKPEVSILPVVEAGNKLPVEIPQQPSFGLLPIIEDGQNSIQPIVEVGHKLPIEVPQKPSFGLLPVIEDGQNSIQPIVEVGHKLPVEVPQKPSFGLLPVIEDGQNSIQPIVEVGHKLPVEVPQKPSFGLFPAIEDGQAIIPDVIGQPEKPSFGLLPVIEEGQNAIQPVIDIGHKLPVVVELPEAPVQPVIRPAVQPAIRPALEPIEEEYLLRPKPVSFPSGQGIIF